MTRGVITRFEWAGIIATTLAVVALMSDAAASEKPKLDCSVGPISKNFGESDWTIYSCNDGRSLVIVSAAGNPAMPFVFFYLASEDGYRLSGEGNGSKTASAAAFEELKLLTDQDIVDLVEETKQN